MCLILQRHQVLSGVNGWREAGLTTIGDAVRGASELVYVGLFVLVVVWLLGWSKLEGRGGGAVILLRAVWRWLRDRLGW